MHDNFLEFDHMHENKTYLLCFWNEEFFWNSLDFFKISKKNGYFLFYSISL
jgi:hypothetical protein